MGDGAGVIARAAPSRAGGGRRERTGLALLGVCLLAAVVYLNSVANGFALDDTFIIRDNPEVHGIEKLAEAVTGSYWPRGPAELGMYRPLTLATFVLDWEIWSGNPSGFHLVNVLLHVVVTGLVLLLLLALGSALGWAAAGAAVFAVHPVHVEAVANIVGRAELLATLFFLAACLVYLRPGAGWGKAAGVGALYLLSLLSKEIGITLPGALVLLHLSRGAGVGAAFRAAREEWRVYLVLGLTFAGYFLLRWVNIGAVLGGGEAPWFWGMSPSARVWTAIRVFPEYVRLMVAPVDLVPDYGPGVIVPERSWSGPLVLLGAATAVIGAAVVVAAWSGARLVTVGVLWFAGTVLPVSGLFFSTGVLLAERTLYLPSVGLAMAVSGLLSLVAVRRPEKIRLAAIMLAAVVVAGSVRTWVQNPVWRDTDSVADHLIATHPTSYRALWAGAARLEQEGRTEEAVDRLGLALRMVPGNYALRMNYGQELYELQRYDAAAAHFDTARHTLGALAQPHVHYLISLIMAGRHAEAATAAGEVLPRFPGHAVLHHLHAQALARAGRFEEARAPRQRAAELEKGAFRWAHWANLAALEVATGDRDAARAALTRARAHAPAEAEVPTVDQLEGWVRQGEMMAIPLW